MGSEEADRNKGREMGMTCIRGSCLESSQGLNNYLACAVTIQLPGRSITNVLKVYFIKSITIHIATFYTVVHFLKVSLYFSPVVGDKESESGSVNVRSRGGKQLGRRPTEEVLMSLKQLRDTRSNQDEF